NPRVTVTDELRNDARDPGRPHAAHHRRQAAARSGHGAGDRRRAAGEPSGGVEAPEADAAGGGSPHGDRRDASLLRDRPEEDRRGAPLPRSLLGVGSRQLQEEGRGGEAAVKYVVFYESADDVEWKAPRQLPAHMAGLV